MLKRPSPPGRADRGAWVHDKAHGFAGDSALAQPSQKLVVTNLHYELQEKDLAVCPFKSPKQHQTHNSHRRYLELSANWLVSQSSGYAKLDNHARHIEQRQFTNLGIFFFFKHPLLLPCYLFFFRKRY